LFYFVGGVDVVMMVLVLVLELTEAMLFLMK